MTGSDGFQVDRAFEFRDRLVVAAELEMRPAETVDDIAVVRPQLGGAAQHAERLVEMFAAIDPGIAEIVQDERLIGVERQRFLEIGFRQRPLLVALVGNAAIIIQRPQALLGLARGGERLGVAVDRGLVIPCASAGDCRARTAHPRRGGVRRRSRADASTPRRSCRASREAARSGCPRWSAAARLPEPDCRCRSPVRTA